MNRSISLLCVLMLGGCTGSDPDASAVTETEEAAAAITNRIDTPPTVRRNLGITFVNVEPRPVRRTMRLPARIEYQPTAHREYRTPVPGRIELLVDQHQVVSAGDPLYRIDGPSWRAMQQSLVTVSSEVDQLTTRLASFIPLKAAHERHESQLGETIVILRERVDRLEAVRAAGGGRGTELLTAQAAVSTAEAELAETLEKEAELEANELQTASALDAARSRRAFHLDAAAMITGLDPAFLEEDVDGAPRWRTLDAVVVHAETPGVVDELGVTPGAWADETTTVVSVVQPEMLRVRGVALQSDAARLRSGLEATIVPPVATRADGAVDLADTMRGTIVMAPGADARTRSIDVFVVPEVVAPWARAGLSVQLEVTVDGDASPTLAIPLAAVQRDGLVSVIFRRDPRDANKVIRMEADLGLDDGRWIVVESGLRRGDEVVLDGAYQLMLASSTAGGGTPSGHFHADGTFHEDHD